MDSAPPSDLATRFAIADPGSIASWEATITNHIHLAQETPFSERYWAWHTEAIDCALCQRTTSTMRTYSIEITRVNGAVEEYKGCGECVERRLELTKDLVGTIVTGQ